MKDQIKNRFPQVSILFQKYKKKLQILLATRENKEVFNEIYESNFWENDESRSGPGSTIKSTKNFHNALIKLLGEYKISTLLDAPCGDFNWMKELNLQLGNYIGVDIVEKLIKDNNKKYGNNNIRFIFADITTDRLPESDMIICRDCFVHLSNARVIKAIRNFKKSGAKYLLTTNYTGVKNNSDIITGEWRKVNMELKPFNFPESLEMIYENCPEVGKNGEVSRDKYLGLWDLEKIKI